MKLLLFNYIKKSKLISWQEIVTFGALILAGLTLIFLAITNLTGCTTERIVYQNITVEHNQTIIMQQPCKCEPSANTTIQIPVADPTCRNNYAILIKEYADCLRNVSRQDSLLQGDCYSQLEHCNSTLQDYTGRINNATWDLNANR